MAYNGSLSSVLYGPDDMRMVRIILQPAMLAELSLNFTICEKSYEKHYLLNIC